MDTEEGKYLDTEYNGRPWEWRTLGVADPGSGEPWKWRTLGVADPGSGVSLEWRTLGEASRHHEIGFSDLKSTDWSECARSTYTPVPGGLL